MSLLLRFANAFAGISSSEGAAGAVPAQEGSLLDRVKLLSKDKKLQELSRSQSGVAAVLNL